jgi:hypothetical protein
MGHIVSLDDQVSTADSSPSLAPRGNLRLDFIHGVTLVKGTSLGQQLDHMKPSDASGKSQHEFRRLNLSRAVLLQKQATFVQDQWKCQIRNREASQYHVKSGSAIFEGPSRVFANLWLDSAPAHLSCDAASNENGGQRSAANA